MQQMNTQKGLGLLDLLTALALLSLAVYVFFLRPLQYDATLEKMRYAQPIASVAGHRLIDEYSKRPSPVVAPAGEYVGEVHIDNWSLPAKYFFGANNRLTVDLLIPAGLLRPETKLRASANYHFNGSVLVFSDVTGDGVLLTASGQPIEVRSADHLVLRGDTLDVVLRRPK